jgi:hypothetical protein
MVDLPRYVHGDKKANGRRYLAYQRYRGTEKAWPRVQLPSDPMSVEFVTRAKLCEQLDATKNEKGWHWQFVDGAGRRHDLPDPKNSDKFWTAAEKAAEVARQIAAGERKTFLALITEFKASAAFQLRDGAAPATEDEPAEQRPGAKRKPGKRKRAGLAKATRDQYSRHMRDIEEDWGDDPVRSLTTVDAQRAIDVFSEMGQPSAGRAFRATLSRLIDWGIPRGYADVNVVEKTEKPAEDGTYEPWPPWAFEHFFEHARLGLHLPVYSGLFTGQRISDVVKMKRPQDGITEMPIIAQKTNAIVPVQIHSEYRAIIKATGHDHEMLHLREDGEPWTYEGFKTAWQREMNRDEFKRFREERIVFHGLRKNAVNNLLEVGCSEALVAAIVKMSLAMVAHYSKRVNQFRLARAAMKQFEAGWAELRPHVLGNVKAAK